MTRSQRSKFRHGWRRGLAASTIHAPDPLGIFSDYLAQAHWIEARGFVKGYKYGLSKFPLTPDQIYLLRTKGPPNLRLLVY